MKNRHVIPFVTVLFILFFFLTSSFALEINEELKLKQEWLTLLDRVYVNWVIDGDTIETAGGERIRLIGVDTPEINYQENTAEYFAREAFRYTKKHLKGKTVYLEYDLQKRDEYGRLLAYVFLSDGTFFNAKLLAKGYARLLLISPNVKYADLYIRLAREARENRRGLWNRLIKEEENLPVISWQEAERYIGKEVIIQGEIVNTYDSGKAVFLNFHREFWHTFKVVIFAADLNKFDYNPADYLLEKEVKIMGRIREFNGVPEIIVKDPVQILIEVP